MEKEQLYKIVENPELIDENAIKQLRVLVNQYPYFYPARVLELIGLKRANSAEYHKKLKETAAFSPNRYNLYLTLNPAPASIAIENAQSSIKNEVVNVQQPKGKEQVAEPTFQLDDSASVTSPANISEEDTPPPAQNQEHNNELLELGDPSEPRHHKTDEEAYLDPQLYTLEIPNDYLEEDSLSASNFGRFNRDDTPRVEEPSKQPKKENEQEEQLDKPEDILTEIAKNVKVSSGHFDQSSLIDNFIETNPRIVPKQRPEDLPAEQEDISLDSVKEPEDAITEPLAAIYIGQGHYSKAISIYEKLCLKFPEKRAYFADQIEKLKNQPDKKRKNH
ncbi:MAG TPA: hypothetical protein ENN24_04815 [Bacteroidetes bacterium]|nr:hypothetical protein [Bacteroidota bacterium]